MSSPEEDEVEKFEITDYDYENEFNINRPQRRQTKSQAIYGSFAGDEDSDEEDDGWNSRPGFGGGKGKKSYSSGISFISGGLKKSAEDEAADTSKGADPEEPQDDNMDPLLQAQFGKPKKSRQRRGFKSADNSSSKGIGDWEKYTNKIGSTLLMKMGYKPGEGLGKDGRGIATPVEAKLRLGKGAIGYYGAERTERSLKDFPVKDEEADEEAKFKEELSRWKRTDTGKKKTNYVYKTADELLAKGAKRKVKDSAGKPSKRPQVKVIDMTGREQRVLSGYHAISTKKQDSDDEDAAYASTDEKKAFEMPELLHNLNMLIDMTEEEIITKDRQLRYERDMTVNMQHESERLETLCAQEAQQISRLTEVLELIDTFEERSRADAARPLTLDECADLFTKLQEEYYDEYKSYDLVTLSIAVVFPLVRRYFAGWQPLSQPTFGCEVMQKWKAILDVDRRHGDSTADHNAYSKLIWDIWMPITRVAISQWNTRNPDALLEVLEAWMPLLPHWMFQNILDQLVNPKLQIEVDNWNPLTDTVPIHAWLHPWLPLMGSRLEPLWAPIRHRLAGALNKWHPSDISAMLMLKPWIRVFSPGHMEAFLVKNIVPKLAVCLDQFDINPSDQRMDHWKWVMAWQPILSDQTLIGLLDRHFFPRWLRTLATWLNTSPNYDEVGVWYKGWKTVLPDRLISHPIIKDRLAQALNVMNSAVSNPGVPVMIPGNLIPPKPPIPGQIPALLSSIYGNNIPDHSILSTPPPPPPVIPEPKRKSANEPIAPPLNGVGSVPHSFKDLVAMKAAEENLEFFPISGKVHEARQVYQCGNVHISIDRGVIFLQESNGWCPVSLNQLLKRASD